MSRSFVIWFPLLILFYLGSSCFYPSPGGDEVIYSVTAQGFSAGHGFSRYAMPGPQHHYELRDYFPPMIHLGMALSYKIFGFGIWQTKFPAWAAASAAAVLIFFLVKQFTNDIRLAEKAVAVFSLNAAIGNAFVSGRFESVYTLFLAAGLFLIFKTANLPSTAMLLAWLVTGLLAGASCLSYYAYAPLSIFIFMLFWWMFVKKSSRPASIRWSAVVFFILGVAATFFLFFELHLKYRPDLFRLQILGQTDTYVGSSFQNLISSIWSEPRRYAALVWKWLGPADIVFLFSSIALMLRSGHKTAKYLAWCCVSWLIFLAVYRTKGPQNLAPIFFPASAGFFISWNEALRGKKVLPQKFSKIIFTGVILFGLLRVTLIGWTVLNQWPSRNYDEVAQSIRTHVPPSARVVAPQTAWYALAGRVSWVHIYGQDFDRTGVQNGAASLNDPNYLKDISHIILDPMATNQIGLTPFVRMARENYNLIYRRQRPFKKLPWSSADPYHIEIYERKKTN